MASFSEPCVSFWHSYLHTKLGFFKKPDIKILVTSVLGSLFLIAVFLSRLISKPFGNLWALPSTQAHSPAMFFCRRSYKHGVSCHHIFTGLVSELVSWLLLLSPLCTTQPVWSLENKDCVTAQVRNLQQLSFSLRIKPESSQWLRQTLSLGSLPQTCIHSPQPHGSPSLPQKCHERSYLGAIWTSCFLSLDCSFSR